MHPPWLAGGNGVTRGASGARVSAKDVAERSEDPSGEEMGLTVLIEARGGTGRPITRRAVRVTSDTDPVVSIL